MMRELPQLNLPGLGPKIVSKDSHDYIQDRIRNKLVRLTPEEWVRQNLIDFLIDHLRFPRGLILVESQLHYFKLKKRLDILIYDHGMKPFFIIECKAPHVKIKSEALTQLAIYNKSTNCPFIGLSNGLRHFCWEKSRNSYVQRKDFPNSSLIHSKE